MLDVGVQKLKLELICIMAASSDRCSLRLPQRNLSTLTRRPFSGSQQDFEREGEPFLHLENRTESGK